MDTWPPLDYAAWKDTRDTLHLWTQVIGKVRLARTPWVNHSWHVPFYLSARGLVTSTIPHDDCVFDAAFDFIDHVVEIRTSRGDARRIELRARSVADFFGSVMTALTDLGVPVDVDPRPTEIVGAVPFDEDVRHAAYDPDAAQRFFRTLASTERVLFRFRSAFLGKSSPVHFFWGSFDLAVTRFSGRRAPPMPQADKVTQEGYSHEVSSVGWWPGDVTTPYPAFYSYASPEPAGFGDAPVLPAAAFYDRDAGQFRLKYDDVRTAASPREALLAFCRSTYEAAATRANWTRGELER